MRKLIMWGAMVGALVCGGLGVGTTEARADHGRPGHGYYQHGHHYQGGYRHGYGYGYQYGYSYPYSLRVYRPGLYIDVPYGPSIAIPFYGRTTVHRPGCCCPCCQY
jgi:hypothetical protein